MKTFAAVFFAIIAAAVVIGVVVYALNERSKAARIQAEITYQREQRDSVQKKMDLIRRESEKRARR